MSLPHDITFESLMEGSPLPQAQVSKGAKLKSRRRKRADDAALPGIEKAPGADRFTISFVSDAVLCKDACVSAESATGIRSFFEESISDIVDEPKHVAPKAAIDQSVVDHRPDSSSMAGRSLRTTCRDVVLAVPENSAPHAFDMYSGACWWDAHTFCTPCISIPGTYDTKNKTFVQWHGAFCSWKCALAYAHHTNRHRNVPMLWELRQKVTGNLRGMQHALHFSELVHFGGTRTIEEFRAASTLTDS